MSENLLVKAELEVCANVLEVWDALINPTKIKEYLYGFDAISEWKEGSDIIFRGEWEGNIFEDKGIIRTFEPNKKFAYSYWSPFFETEDKIENYVDYTFLITPMGDKTLLAVSRNKINTKEEWEKENEGCLIFLNNIKKVIEKN